ncbi:glycosyltransferase, partial [bacterium]|nr:glycosyltransferase [bacterium]
HLAGAQPNWLPSHDHIRHISTVELDHYAELLAGFDIGIAPLIDNKFNSCKSDLKFLEYSKIGMPSVLSKVAPYMRSVRHGENGFLATNTKDWLKYLRTLIKDAELREAMSARAWEFAQGRLMSRNIEKWLRAYGL